MISEVKLYFAKAEESLSGAESEFANQRYNNCANRCYYACFQAAIAALVQANSKPKGKQWAHEFVHGEFVGILINKRKLYPTDLRTTLALSLELRQVADYRGQQISQIQASRSLHRVKEFVTIIGERITKYA